MAPRRSARVAPRGPDPDPPAPASPEGDGSAPDALPVAEDDPLALPPHGAAVRLDGLPAAASVAQVAAFAERAGPVHSVALEAAVEGAASAAARVTFASVAGAAAAVAALAGGALPDFPAAPTRVRVTPPSPDHRLFVGGLDRGLALADLEAAARAACGVRGLEAVELVTSKDAPTSNRGFGFLNFYNGAAAAAALGPLAALTLGGRPVTVSLAAVKPPPPPKAGTGPPAARGVHVTGLGGGWSGEELEAAFAPLGAVDRVVLPPPRDGRPPPDYAFVYFEEEEAAVAAVAAAARGEGPSVGGAPVAVGPARAPAGGVSGGGRGPRPGMSATAASTSEAGEDASESAGVESRGAHSAGPGPQRHDRTARRDRGRRGAGAPYPYPAPASAAAASAAAAVAAAAAAAGHHPPPAPLFGQPPAPYGHPGAYGAPPAVMLPMLLPTGQVGYILAPPTAPSGFPYPGAVHMPPFGVPAPYGGAQHAAAAAAAAAGFYAQHPGGGPGGAPAGPARRHDAARYRPY